MYTGEKICFTPSISHTSFISWFFEFRSHCPSGSYCFPRTCNTHDFCRRHRLSLHFCSWWALQWWILLNISITVNTYLFPLLLGGWIGPTKSMQMNSIGKSVRVKMTETLFWLSLISVTRTPYISCSVWKSVSLCLASNTVFSGNYKFFLNRYDCCNRVLEWSRNLAKPVELGCTLIVLPSSIQSLYSTPSSLMNIFCNSVSLCSFFATSLQYVSFFCSSWSCFGFNGSLISLQIFVFGYLDARIRPRFSRMFSKFITAKQ